MSRLTNGVATSVFMLSGEKTVYQFLLIGWVSKISLTSIPFTSSLSFNMSFWVLLNLLSSTYERSTGLCVDLTVVSASGLIPRILVWLGFAGSVPFIILIKVLDLSSRYQLLSL